MARKTYKNKGVPVKGSEIRTNRTVRLSESAWAALDEVAKLTNTSRAQLIEWWSAVLTNNEEKMAEIAANENCSVDELSNRIWEMNPNMVRQIQANRQPYSAPSDVKAQDESRA